jgi:uncharacterized DUF497 family protein
MQIVFSKVVFTKRGDLIRVISGRDMNKRERKGLL